MPCRAAASRWRWVSSRGTAAVTTAVSCLRRLAASARLSSRVRSNFRPRGASTDCRASRAVSAATLPCSRRPTSSALPCGSMLRLTSASRSAGLPATIRSNRKSSSSTWSPRLPASAEASTVSTARLSTVALRSRSVDQRWATSSESTSTAAWFTFPPNSRATRSRLARASRLGSATARRRVALPSMSAVMPNRASARAPSPRRMPARTGRHAGLRLLQRARNRASGVPALLGRAVAAEVELGLARGSRLGGSSRSRSAHLLGRDLPRLELGEEAVHDPLLAGLLLQRLAHDPAGQVGGETTHLGAQRDDRLLALGLDLLLRRLREAAGLGLGLAAHLGDDQGALLAGLLADAGSLGAGLGELRLVLLESRLGLLLGLLGLLHAALDRGGALGIRLLEVRHHHLRHDPVQDRERDEAEDQLTHQGQDGQALAGGVLSGRQAHDLRDAGEVLHGVLLVLWCQKGWAGIVRRFT